MQVVDFRSHMRDGVKDQIPELMERLGISGKQLQNVKLGPGIVGRNSTIIWVFLIVMLTGVICGAILKSQILVGGSLIGAVCVALVGILGNIHFGKRNPAAAILEGAEFLEFHQMQMTASKGQPPTTLPEPPIPQPIQISTKADISLPSGGEQAE